MIFTLATRRHVMSAGIAQKQNQQERKWEREGGDNNKLPFQRVTRFAGLNRHEMNIFVIYAKASYDEDIIKFFPPLATAWEVINGKQESPLNRKLG